MFCYMVDHLLKKGGHKHMHQGAEHKNTLPDLSIEHVKEELSLSDLNDLCDATDDAIEHGGGFGWTKLPARDILERYWQGVIIMPQRDVFIARMDGVICGSAQMAHPPAHNEAQAHSVQLTTLFIAPWARGNGLARSLVNRVEQQAKSLGKTVVNLDIRETQEDAIALYKSMGYEEYATHPAYAYVDGHYVAGKYFFKILS